MNKYLKLSICIALPLVTGGIAGFVTTQNIPTWYAELTKPSFNPPNYLFGPVWSTLYVLMGISWFLIFQSKESKERTFALRIFYLQWILNFCWSFLFFHFHALGLALIEIGLMWYSILLMIIGFSKVHKVAAYLQIPYIAWVSFASVLNASIWYLNL
jgi:translocator protein